MTVGPGPPKKYNGWEPTQKVATIGHQKMGIEATELGTSEKFTDTKTLKKLEICFAKK